MSHFYASLGAITRKGGRWRLASAIEEMLQGM
jgi:hypothetical protein